MYSCLLGCSKTIFAMISLFSWQNSVSLSPASFCTQRPNLPVIPCISWLSISAFQSPMMKRTSFFFGVSFRICCGLPRRFSGKESTCQYRRWKRYSFDPRIGKILWRGKWQPLKYSCLENHGQRSLAGYSPWGHTKSDTTEWLSMHTRRYSRCSLYQSVSASSVSVVLA